MDREPKLRSDRKGKFGRQPRNVYLGNKDKTLDEVEQAEVKKNKSKEKRRNGKALSKRINAALNSKTFDRILYELPELPPLLD